MSAFGYKPEYIVKQPVQWILWAVKQAVRIENERARFNAELHGRKLEEPEPPKKLTATDIHEFLKR